MTTEEWVIKVENPPVTGQRVKDLQWQLSGHNRFNYTTYRGNIDGIFGPDSGEASKKMKFYLGYPDDAVAATAGSTLRAYLLPKEADDAKILPAAYQTRKKERAAKVVSYPAARVGSLIGFPYQGTHTLGNWESDRACDISLPVGTPMLACFSGVIGPQFGPLHSTNPRLLGLRLHIVRTDGREESYYAHLSKFAPGLSPGDQVKAGDVIGYSGVANGVAHLHWALEVGWPPTFLRDTSSV